MGRLAAGKGRRVSTNHVVIDYTNWRGERATRVIEPWSITFGRTEHHPERQWLIKAWDIEKEAVRTFAMKDIHSWQPVS